MPGHTSPEHVIPSIPASQALRLLAQTQAQTPNHSPSQSSQSSSAPPLHVHAHALTPVSTGLDGLDRAIAAGAGGFARGSVTEIYGPPGVGKTALLLHAAVKALGAGQHVVWIDTGSPIPRERVQRLLKLAASSNSDNRADPQAEAIQTGRTLTHIRASSLPHLLSLLAHPPAGFPPEGTSLIVVDSVSAPFQAYFPNATEIRARLAAAAGAGAGSGTSAQTQWLLNRRRNVASDLASYAAKLAATRGLAVVLLNQTHTKIRGLPRPTLYPAVSAGGAWENCISTRIVLYRDFAASHESVGSPAERRAKLRLAEMMKKGGKVLGTRAEGDVVRFVIDHDGLHELSPPAPLESKPVSATLPVSVRKRKAGEIADSEEEQEFSDEYDWEQQTE